MFLRYRHAISCTLCLYAMFLRYRHAISCTFCLYAMFPRYRHAISCTLSLRYVPTLSPRYLLYTVSTLCSYAIATLSPTLSPVHSVPTLCSYAIATLSPTLSPESWFYTLYLSRSFLRHVPELCAYALLLYCVPTFGPCAVSALLYCVPTFGPCAVSAFYIVFLRLVPVLSLLTLHSTLCPCTLFPYVKSNAEN